MVEKRLEISQNLHPHHMKNDYTPRKVLKVRDAYENYIFENMKQFNYVIKTTKIFNGRVKLFDGEVSINVTPRYFTTTNFFNITIERSDILDANVTYCINFDHQDMNYLKLKDYKLYEQYLSNEYNGLIEYLSKRLRECLEPVAITYDYNEDMRLRKK